MKKKEFSNHEIVTLIVFLLGGASKSVDSEDVAMKANELAPGRFVWKKYKNQVNLEIVRVYLSDAKKTGKGGYLLGSGKEGWMLSEKGLSFAKKCVTSLKNINLAREPLSVKERAWRRNERIRLLACDAFLKFQEKGPQVSIPEIEAFFRVDSYVVGKARERKITRLVNTFGEDPELGPAIRELATKLREARNV